MAISENISGAARARCALRVRGTVQGVGFRPAVARIARRARLGGFVRNDSEGAWIEVEGNAAALAEFTEAIRREIPSMAHLARITSIEPIEIPPRGDIDFRITPSESATRSRTIVPPDAATCDACLGELFDPGNRRFRYPFINCTDCGPRFTIVTDLPYDRPKTTMSAFAMCADCRAEYDDPEDRRFHAEPNACAACGPQVALVQDRAVRAVGDAAVAAAIELLRGGAIVAVKGLGGYQLAVDATDAAAVGRLRARKRRPHKPFAIMGRDIASLAPVALLDEVALDALQAAARPVVVVPRTSDGRVADVVAPHLNELGLMLPATPLHHLLFDGGPPLLVMTSGNRAEEPIARDEAEAAEALAYIADAILWHDRAIHTRADDSVVRIVAGAAQPIRRARGIVPESIALGAEGPCVLAVGPHLKSTICFTRGADAYLSQHIGDLEGLEAQAFFEEVIAKFAALLGTRPTAVAHDLHPDYVSTRWAVASGLPAVGVQHHHAHIASCMAEHDRSAPVIGVAFDGTGCGPSGELWGGEFMLADRRRFRRVGHLRPLALAGGEAAIRQPWRVALAALLDAGESPHLLAWIEARQRDAVVRMIDRGAAVQCATGAGRWFDAIAAMVGVRDTITYEGQAAVELESVAAGASDDRPYPYETAQAPDAPFVVDLRPTVRAVAMDLRRRAPAANIAARFHSTLADAIVDSCRRLRATHDLHVVALSGGCFQNRRLTEQVRTPLVNEGFDVLVHRRVPPNDAGVALGQAAVAHSRLQWDLEGREHRHVPRHPR